MSADTAAEEQFGPYLVYERLGVGGMATVHRALERGGGEGFERTVALKRLLPHLAEDASFIKSFVREAKLASILHHVNIVQIYELGRVGTEYFISMEYIDGRDIRRILRHARKATGPPPLHVTVGLLTQLCDALDYAHHKMDDDGHPLGLVHRDVSPSNLLVTTAGHLKVIDFGIAKAQSSQLRTQTGRVKGKLAYMAPEAIGGRDVDARSDLFAAGVIAHELLTARPLFASKNEYQTLLKVQRGEIVPPSAFNQACPPEMDAIVLRALAREPDERYPNAAAMREDLGKLRRAHGLATGVRDVAAWVDWAFDQEAPAGGFANAGTVDQTGSAIRATPVPRSIDPHRHSAALSAGDSPRSITPISVKQRAATPRPEDDEAVEIAWGGGAEDGGDAAGPLVLDDIPDVSGKHLVPRESTDVEHVSEHGDHADDIPQVMPSHGERPGRTPTNRTTPPPLVRARPSAPPATFAELAADAHDDPGTTGRILAARATTNREPRPDDTLPSGLDARQFPTEQIATLADDPVVEPPPPVAPPASQRARTTSQRPPARPSRPSSRPAPQPPEDLVRASEPMLDTPPYGTQPDPLAVPPLGAPPPAGNIPRTTPGVHPARARAQPTSAPPARDPNETSTVAAEAAIARHRAGNVMIGAALIERDRGRGRWWIPAALGVLVLGGGGAFYGLAMREPAAPRATGGEPAPRADSPSAPSAPVAPATPAAPEPGTLKFVIEPVAAEIRIDNKDAHTGTAWSTELPPGSYPIEIRGSGYKSYLTTIDLSSRETQTLRVVLEPVSAVAPVAADATLVLATTPAGLEATLDGSPLAQPTPLKLAIHPGAHVIAVRRGGIEVWHQAVTARPDAVYEYAPSFTAEKERERHAHREREHEHEHEHEHEIAPESREAPADAAVVAATPPIDVPVTLPPPVDAGVVIVAPPPPVTPPAPPVGHGPQPIVPPNAVTRVSGDPPSFTAFRGTELPAVVNAKVCIDLAGHVTSADVMTKIDRRAASDIAEALRAWLYAPYKTRAGAASGACFVVPMRTR